MDAARPAANDGSGQSKSPNITTTDAPIRPGEREITDCGAGSSAAASETAGEITAAGCWNLRFLAAEARIYAEHRAAYYEGVGKALAVLNVLAGSAVMASLATGGWGVGLGLTITMAGALDIVFGFSKQAAGWRRAVEVDRDIEIDAEHLGPNDVAGLKALRSRFYSVKPPEEREYLTLKKVAYNGACRQLGCPSVYTILLWRHLTRNVLSGRDDPPPKGPDSLT